MISGQFVDKKNKRRRNNSLEMFCKEEKTMKDRHFLMATIALFSAVILFGCGSESGTGEQSIEAGYNGPHISDSPLSKRKRLDRAGERDRLDFKHG